jgi:hypothetical protein
MEMNTEQASKRAMWTPSLCERDEGRRLDVKRATRTTSGATGVLVMVWVQRNNESTREALSGGRETLTGDPRGSDRAAQGDGEVRSSEETSNDRGAKGP